MHIKRSVAKSSILEDIPTGPKYITGITNMMLSQSLKQLEEYGVIIRKQYNEVPVRVEYQLTENGFSLLSKIRIFVRFKLQK